MYLAHFCCQASPPPPPLPLPQGLGSWILDFTQNIPKKASFPSDPKSRIQNPGPRTLREWGGGGGPWILDLGSWIFSRDSTKEGKYCENPESKIRSRSHTGRQNCASSLRKRSLDEGLMSFLEIQCVPRSGPEPPQDHRSRLRGSKGAFRCWQGQDHEARSKTPITTVQSRNTSLFLKFQWGLPETHSQSGSQGSLGRSPLESNSLKSGEKSSGMFNYTSIPERRG